MVIESLLTGNTAESNSVDVDTDVDIVTDVVNTTKNKSKFIVLIM